MSTGGLLAVRQFHEQFRVTRTNDPKSPPQPSPPVSRGLCCRDFLKGPYPRPRILTFVYCMGKRLLQRRLAEARNGETAHRIQLRRTSKSLAALLHAGDPPLRRAKGIRRSLTTRDRFVPLCGPLRPSLRSFCGPNPRGRPRNAPKRRLQRQRFRRILRGHRIKSSSGRQVSLGAVPRGLAGCGRFREQSGEP